MKKSILIHQIDKKHECVKIVLNKEIYALQSIYAASYVFLDKAYILLDQDKNKNTEIFLFSKGSADLQKLGKEFCNEIINYAHYFSRVETNASTIKTIMQRILFTVNPKFAEEAEEQEIQDLLKELEKDTLNKK